VFIQQSAEAGQVVRVIRLQGELQCMGGVQKYSFDQTQGLYSAGHARRIELFYKVSIHLSAAQLAQQRVGVGLNDFNISKVADQVRIIAAEIDDTVILGTP